MTETEQLPDLSRMEEGNEYTVYYRSQRSGNEVDRTGTVTTAIETDDGPIIRLHTEQRDCYKHTYVALTEAETKSGDDCVAAYSMTVEADPPNGGDPPTLGEAYVVQFESARTSLLGIVDRVVREDGPGPFLVTDGGTMPAELEQKFYDHIQKAEDMEQVSWLFWTYEGIKDSEWKNVAYRCWVLTEKYDDEHILLVNAIDRHYGYTIEEAKADDG